MYLMITRSSHNRPIHAFHRPNMCVRWVCCVCPVGARKNVPFLERVSNVENVMNAMLIKMELMDVHQVGWVGLG